MNIQTIQDLIINRGNDLTEFFWPLFYYVKQSILDYHQIPLWNNLFFAGTPLISDPQNPTWYFLNIIFLFLDIDSAILVSILIHSLLGMITMYLVSKIVFKFKKTTNLAIAIAYTLSPIYFSFLEAGHWGLIICWAWLPLLILGSYKLTTKPNLKWIFLFSLAATSIYFGHVLTAAISFFAVGIYFLYKKSFVWPTIAGIISLIIIFPAFYSQFQWQKDTTRNMLLNFPETFPIWKGKTEFVKSIFIFNPETEKAITFGVIPSLIAVFGFLKVSKKLKIGILFVLIFISLIVLNNTSPIGGFLNKQSIFIMMRVSTRVWFLAYFVLLYLFGVGFEKLNINLRKIITCAVIIELVFIGTSYISKPLSDRNFAPEDVYNFLSSDSDIFKVFCTTRCLSQKDTAIHNLHLADGYGTLQQNNYFEAAMQIGQYYWNKYSLEIPPASIYLFNKLQPYAPSLSDYGIKYVISPHPLSDKNLEFVMYSKGYIVYKNSLYKSLDYKVYTPNHIRINILNETAVEVPEIYNKNWVANDQNKNLLIVSESTSKTLEVKINSDTIYVDLYFSPSFVDKH